MSEAKRQRRAEVAERAQARNATYQRCRIVGCSQPTTSAHGSGLNRLYCRRHEDHHARHGSYTKPSYRAAELEPYRKAALRWLKVNADSHTARLAIEAVKHLYTSAGAATSAHRLRGLSPGERARAAWARLREAEVSPLKPIAAWLAVELAIKADLQPETKQEYKLVQAAKVLHRLASGTHKRWERERPGGNVVVEEMHKYPHSRGQVLRHLGKQLQSAVELLAAHHVEEISALATQEPERAATAARNI